MAGTADYTGNVASVIELLAGPGQVVEVRALAENATHSGYFTDYAALAQYAGALDTDPAVHGTYVTLNRVNPSLLSRRANRIKMRLARTDTTTSDAEITRRRWFPVDIDPVRPGGVSSSNPEHEAAFAMAERVALWLGNLGFPEPVRADSGNGAHLLYRIDLPNDDASLTLVKRGLAVLDAIFSDESATVDKTNSNAGRIWKLYGTIARKGDNTAERPHRRSRVLSVPERLDVVSGELLANLGAALPGENCSPAVSPGEARRITNQVKLPDWLRSHAIPVRSEKLYQGGRIYLLTACPFSAAHTDGAYAIQFENGAIHAGCHHASCGGGKQRWQEPGSGTRQRRSGLRSRMPGCWTGDANVRGQKPQRGRPESCRTGGINHRQVWAYGTGSRKALPLQARENLPFSRGEILATRAGWMQGRQHRRNMP
jgi:hypothetical protein